MTTGLVCVTVRDHVFSDEFRRLVRPCLKSELDGNLPPHLKLCEFVYEKDPSMIGRLVRRIAASVNRVEFLATAVESVCPAGKPTDFNLTLNVSKTGQIDLFHDGFCEKYPSFTNPTHLQMTLEVGEAFEGGYSRYRDLLTPIRPFSFFASSVSVYRLDDDRYWPVCNVLIKS